MADNNTLTRRGERGADFQIDNIDLRRRKVEQALPSHFVKEYPDFVEFLTTYYEFLESDQGLDRMVERLRDVRNADIAQGDYIERMMCEYGEGFPDLGTLTDANALKLFHMWFKSKGNQEAIEAYFRLFLNTEAEVIYPKDNMLRVSDGNWDNDAQRWEDQQGHISETTMVIQDSTFYQIYSYLVRSGVSIADWGAQFRELAHPAGWNLFGEVRIEGLAQFEQYRAVTRSGARSPQIVPGFQTRDANILILTAAIYFVVGNTAAAPIDHRMRTFPQFIRKYWKVVVADGDDAYSLESVNKNIITSTHTIGELKDFRINEINEPSINRTIKLPNQRPARFTYKGASNIISGLSSSATAEPGSKLDSFIPPDNEFVLDLDFMFPMDRELNGTIIEEGGSGRGFWFGITESNLLRVRFGDGGSEVEANLNCTYADYEFRRDGQMHNVVVEINPTVNPNTLRLWIDGVVQTPVQSYYSLINTSSHGNADGGYFANGHINVVGEPTYKLDSWGGTATVYDAQLIT
jgi:hypothetical protein